MYRHGDIRGKGDEVGGSSSDGTLRLLGAALIGLVIGDPRLLRRCLRFGVIVSVVAATGTVMAPAATATTATCAHSSGHATVTIAGADPVSLSADAAGNILVSGVPCDAATVENTTRVLVQGGQGVETVVLDERGGALASTEGVRVKVALMLGDGNDVIILHRSTTNDQIAIGERGITVTPVAEERHVVLDGATDVVKVRAGGGADVVSAAGSPIVGGPYAGQVMMYGEDGNDSVIGGTGSDLLAGGRGNDRLTGDAGPDSLLGGAGRDRLLGGLGNDDLGGGAGKDVCYQYAGRGRRHSCELPLARSPLPASPPGQLLVVNQNLRESHRVTDHVFPWLRDLKSHQEFANFADRLPTWVPYAPDILVLQEVTGLGARRVATALERVFDLPYEAVVRPARALRIIETKNGITLVKKNTAIIINERTTKFVRGGYLASKQLERDRTAGRKFIQHQAHALLKERATGMRASVAAIHFNANKRFSSDDLANQRRVAWSKQAARYVRQHYPNVGVRILGGEFCTRRCMDVVWETVTCDESRLWEVLTDDFHYVDAVYVANSSSKADIREQQTSNHGRPHRIDYIFVKGNVLSASRDVGYQAYAGDRHYISDHKGDFALVTPQ